VGISWLAERLSASQEGLCSIGERMGEAATVAYFKVLSLRLPGAVKVNHDNVLNQERCNSGRESNWNWTPTENKSVNSQTKSWKMLGHSVQECQLSVFKKWNISFLLTPRSLTQRFSCYYSRMLANSRDMPIVTKTTSERPYWWSVFVSCYGLEGVRKGCWGEQVNIRGRR